ncbi:MAG: glycerol-3-phosphate acyltransferase, partial [Candidatus Babeliales bacterium]
MRRYRGDVIDYFFLLITFFCAYFIGSFPTSYCMAYYFHGIDIRLYGSGNSGATNMARVLGWRYFFPIVVIDVVKAFACLAIIRSYDGSSEIVMAWVAFALLLGNSFPFYLGFRGGKGVA